MIFTNPVSEMSDEEKSFYYFKLHDMDNNDALDGLELIQAAMHQSHDHPTEDDHNNNTPANPDGEQHWTHVIGMSLVRLKFLKVIITYHEQL